MTKSSTPLLEFHTWLENALPGDKFCYFKGPHLIGESVGRAALYAYEKNQVILFQKREGKEFAYFAQRKKEYRV